jgi:hypothetical protein
MHLEALGYPAKLKLKDTIIQKRSNIPMSIDTLMRLSINLAQSIIK